MANHVRLERAAMYDQEVQVLQNAAEALGNGTALDVKGMGSAALQLTGTMTSLTVTFEATVDDSNWIAIRGTNVNSGAQATTATAAGIFVFATVGLHKIRARVSTYVSGNVTVKGYAMPEGIAPVEAGSVAGTVAIDQATPGTTNGVQVVAALPAGTNSIGVVDTELPTAAALANGAAVPTTPKIGAVGMLYNGSTVDFACANTEGTLLASATRTATTASSNQTNYNARGVLVWLKVTAASGTGGLTLQIGAIEPVGGAGPWFLSAAPTAVTTVNTFLYMLYPGIGSIAGEVTQNTSQALPRAWLIRVAHGDASNYTYSVGYSLIL